MLEDWIMALDKDTNIPDVWVWPGKSGAFSAKSFYTLMHSHLPTIQPCKWLWKSRCTMKIKVFGWLLFFDRLNTKDLLIHRHWRSPLDDNLCVICNEYVYEDRLHFFSTAILVAEFGAIFALTGPGALISSNDFGMSAAIGLFQSVLCFITVTIVNKLVGLYDKDYALF